MRSTTTIGKCVVTVACALVASVVVVLPAQAATYSGGTGTSGDPYLIWTSQDLLDLANPDNSADWDKHFLMTNDIDMTGGTGFRPAERDRARDPAGLQRAMFTALAATTARACDIIGGGQTEVRCMARVK